MLKKTPVIQSIRRTGQGKTGSSPILVLKSMVPFSLVKIMGMFRPSNPVLSPSFQSIHISEQHMRLVLCRGALFSGVSTSHEQFNPNLFFRKAPSFPYQGLPKGSPVTATSLCLFSSSRWAESQR